MICHLHFVPKIQNNLELQLPSDSHFGISKTHFFCIFPQLNVCEFQHILLSFILFCAPTLITSPKLMLKHNLIHNHFFVHNLNFQFPNGECKLTFEAKESQYHIMGFLCNKQCFNHSFRCKFDLSWNWAIKMCIMLSCCCTCEIRKRIINYKSINGILTFWKHLETTHHKIWTKWNLWEKFDGFEDKRLGKKRCCPTPSNIAFFFGCILLYNKK